MRKLILVLLCGHLMLHLSACSTNEQVLETARLPNPPSQVFVDEVFIYGSEDEFVQAYADPHGGIAKMDYALPDFYLRPVNLPKELSFKSIQLEPYGYTWRYTTPEDTEVWFSTIHKHFSNTHTLDDEVKANLSTKYEYAEKISMNNREYIYLDATHIDLGFSLILFLDNDTLVSVMIGDYNITNDMFEKYCNVEKVTVENIVHKKEQ